MEYEFMFVVDGVSAEDDAAVGVVSDEFDGLLSSHRGVQLLTVSDSGVSAVDAAHRLVVGLRRALPAMRVLRLDPDLVGVPDIAERTSRTRQNVLQWVGGERRKGRPFPPPEGTAGRSLVWRWGEVNAWLREIGEGDEVLAPLREEAHVIDVMVPQWQRAMDAGPPVIKMLVPQDERLPDRAATAALLDGALRAPGVLETVAALPRSDPDRLIVTCAVLTDRLDFVLEQIAPDGVSGLLAVRVDDGELQLIGVASRALPGTRPIAELGLSGAATVGDLVLQLTHGGVASNVPLALS
jgi:predicted DNA-binding transcriptional regulator AlpA